MTDVAAQIYLKHPMATLDSMRWAPCLESVDLNFDILVVDRGLDLLFQAKELLLHCVRSIVPRVADIRSIQLDRLSLATPLGREWRSVQAAGHLVNFGICLLRQRRPSFGL